MIRWKSWTSCHSACRELSRPARERLRVAIGFTGGGGRGIRRAIYPPRRWIIGAILGAYWLAGLALPTTKEDVAAGVSEAIPLSHDEYVARFRSVRSSGGSIEDGLAELRAAGAHMGDSAKALREAEGIGLGQAKIILDESATWADLRPTNEWLRDLAEESIRSESDVRDTENGLPDQAAPRRRS